MQKQFRIKLLPVIALLAAGPLFFQSCNDTTVIQDTGDRQAYIIPDSLLKTLTFDSVRQGELINAITLTGQVDFNQDKEVNIYPLISGNVQDAKAQLGDYVTKGQVLAVVKSSEMANYTNNLIIAETNVTATKKQLDATKDLFSSGLASNLDVINAQVNYDQAVAQLNMVKKVLKINGNDTSGQYVVRAPIDGFIVQKLVTNSMAIRPDNTNPLYTISDLKDVWVWANVYEANLDKVHMGDNLDVTTLSYPDRVFKGKVDKIMHVLDPNSKVTKVRVAINNADYALRPQMFASVTVTNTQHKQAMYVPAGALMFDASKYYVLTYHGGGKSSITPVEKLSSLGNKVYLTSGVKVGDVVLTSDVIQIYDQLNN
jgi:membrane fusion protein, heavy metal efflux system